MEQMVQSLRNGAPLEAWAVLQVVQPALLGFIDGAVSTLAPLFAAAELTHSTAAAFFVGLAGALGAGISMGLAEALSEDGIGDPRGVAGWVTRGVTGPVVASTSGTTVSQWTAELRAKSSQGQSSEVTATITGPPPPTAAPPAPL